MPPANPLNRLPPISLFKTVVPLSIHGDPPPTMPPQPEHLEVKQKPTFFGPGFVTYLDPDLGKRVTGCYICKMGKTNTITHVPRLERHMTLHHFNALKRHWLKTEEALTAWKDLLPRYECPKPGCTHVSYRGNDDLRNHYKGKHPGSTAAEISRTADVVRRKENLTAQCAVFVARRCDPSIDEEEDDDDDSTYDPDVANRVDRRIDEDYDGDSTNGSGSDELLASDTDDSCLDRMEEDEMTSPSSNASAVGDTTDTYSAVTPTTDDDHMDAEDDNAARETDDAMSVTGMEDDNETSGHVRPSEHAPPVPVAAPKRVRAPRRTAGRGAASKAKSSGASPTVAHNPSVSPAPHATDAPSRGRSPAARNTPRALNPRAATTTPPPRLKRTHSVVESPGQQAAPTEGPRVKRYERVVYERVIERVVVYDRPGAESAPPHIQRFHVRTVDEYGAVQPMPPPPMGHHQGGYAGAAPTARSHSTADVPRYPVPPTRDVPMEHVPTPPYRTHAAPVPRPQSAAGVQRVPVPQTPLTRNMPAGYAPAQPDSEVLPNIARHQAAPPSATAAQPRPTAGGQPDLNDLRRQVVHMANSMSDEELMLRFQRANNLPDPRLPQDR